MTPTYTPRVTAVVCDDLAVMMVQFSSGKDINEWV